MVMNDGNEVDASGDSDDDGDDDGNNIHRMLIKEK